MNYKQCRHIVEIFVSPEFGHQKLDLNSFSVALKILPDIAYKYMSYPINGVFMKELGIC